MRDETIGRVFGGAAIDGIAALSRGIAQATAISAAFERQIASIEIVQKTSKRQMRKLRKRALDLGKETSFSAKEAAQGVEDLKRADLNVREIIEGAARATEISVEEFDAAEDTDA